MTLVDLKPPRKRASRALPLEQATASARFFEKMCRDIEADLGGKRQLSRIESELVRAFAGAATQLHFLNRQILLGEGSEIDLAGFSQLASTLLRIGSRLGTGRRTKQVLDMDNFLEMRRRARGIPPEESVK